MNISGTEHKPAKNSLGKIKVNGLAFGILLFVSDIGANSFAHFQFGTSISDKDKYLSRIVGGEEGGVDCGVHPYKHL